MCAWPITAVTESFHILNHYSPMNYGTFGINRIIENMLEEQSQNKEMVSNDKNNFLVNAKNAHISTALNATYFPFSQTDSNGLLYSDSAVSNVMCDLLKVYWYNQESISKIAKLYRNNCTEQNILKLFCCKENIDVLKVAEVSDKYQTHRMFRELLIRLDTLNESERHFEIKKLNDILYEVNQITDKSQYSITKFFFSASGFLPISFGASSVLNALGIIKDKFDTSDNIEKSAELKLIEKYINKHNLSSSIYGAEDIYCLDKISRVACLK